MTWSQRCPQVIGWENIELISDRPLEVMLEEFKRLKAEFPGRILIASIMEEYNKVGIKHRRIPDCWKHHMTLLLSFLNL